MPLTTTENAPSERTPLADARGYAPLARALATPNRVAIALPRAAGVPLNFDTLCINMTVITELEANFGIPFPPGYCDWSLKKYTDHREGMDRYLRVHEAEWIPPDEIPQYDVGRSNIISGLIPFAFGGAGDHWCWNTRVKNGDAEYEVLCCWHDEKLADRFAPTFPAWFYRNCLDYASGAFDRNYADIDEARKNLRIWSEKLSEIHPGAWAEHLAILAEKQPSEYKHPKLRADITMFGFITAMKVDEIVADQFGPGYLGQKVEWEV